MTALNLSEFAPELGWHLFLSYMGQGEHQYKLRVLLAGKKGRMNSG